MEEFDSQMSGNSNSGGGCGFLYGNPADAPMNNSFYLQPLSGVRLDGSDDQQRPIVKAEAAGTSQNHGCAIHWRRETETVDAMKARIVDHPQYSNLLDAYMNCQKVGAPPEAEARLTAVRREFELQQLCTARIGCESKDPELDQFMEAYYDMLVKYGEELSRPLREAMDFMRRIEAQLSSISNNPVRVIDSGNVQNKDESEGLLGINPCGEDQELKNHLLKKYSGYLSSLKQELSKKKKTGKLPKEARQKLLAWWELHYKWPYPSESEKLALAEATGLDQKQINNWFINQRKRHWKPSDDMQMFMVTDGHGLHRPQNAAAAAAFYTEGHYMGDDCPYRNLGP